MTSHRGIGPRGLRRGWSSALGLLAAVLTIGTVLVVPGAAEAATVDEIKLAQTNLNGLDYNAGAVDGRSGPQTLAATQAFQGDRCLSVDGAIGPLTLSALDGVVRQVQTKAGMAPDGRYEASTRTAVASYQGAHGLAANGVAGADTMTAMGIVRVDPTCHGPGPDGARVVEIAKGELGTREGSGNCVPGKPYSICQAWCAAFTTWVWRTAGSDIPAINYVPSVYDWAVAHGKWYGTSQLGMAQPGYMIIFGTATNRWHIGIVDYVSGGTVYVIAGNSSNPANASQQGVYERAYPLSSSTFYGLVRL